MKLHLGCGKRYLEGYTNCDLQTFDGYHAPDIVCDFRKVPLENSCATEILAVHIFEHVYRWEVDGLLEEWKRLLKPGGLLALEMPDIIKCCRNLLNEVKGKHHPDQMSYWGLYGDPTPRDPYMVHRWGWHAGTLGPLLEEHGFISVVEQKAQFHKPGRDFRMEATKL